MDTLFKVPAARKPREILRLSGKGEPTKTPGINFRQGNLPGTAPKFGEKRPGSDQPLTDHAEP